MKKFLLIAVAAFGMLMTACSKDEVAQPIGGEESVVTFTVEAPVMATRATEHGDGKTATELNWAVYDRNADEGSEPLFTDSKNFDQNKLTTTVEIPFVNGMTYDVLFWAEAPGTKSPYAVDWAAKTVGYADATKLVSNSEDYDAFYYFLTGDELKVISGPVTKSVVLKRPFAQLNIITNDADKAEQSDVVVKDVKVVVENGYSSFDLAAGEGETEGTVTFDTAPAQTTTDVLAVNYLFTGGEKSLVDVVFSYTDLNNKVSAEGRTMEFASVPVQRNYRTNIVGSLLTSDGKFNIEILPEFEGEENDDRIFNATDLQAALDAAPENATTVINLGANIEANVTDIQKPGRKVVIDGRGYKYNGTIKVHSNSNHYADAALTIKNLKFETSTASVNFIEALENGSERYSCNITVENCTFTATDAAVNTAVGVQIKASKNAKVIGCTATNVHSLIQAQSCDQSVLVQNCTVNGKNGVAFKQVKNAVVEGNTITATGYGIRFDGNIDNYGITVKDNTVTAAQPFIVRKMTGKDNTIALEGTNTLTTGETYQIVITNGSDDETYVEPTGTYTLTGADSFVVYPAIENYDAFIEKISDDTWYDDTKTELAIEDVADFAAFVETANSGNDFEGKTLKLTSDIDLYFKDVTAMADGDPATFRPIGDTQYNGGKPFKGTFDGQGHTIKNLYQNGWDLGYNWDVYGSYGLFGKLENATVKNVVIEGSESYIEGGDVSFIAGSATGTCVFENITINSGVAATYNNGCGGIIGWSGAGNYTFKNITIGKDAVLGGLWGSFDSSIGGIVGQAEPGATYNFENVTINCRIDAYNDCTASYDYYNYRMCGMIIGRCEETTTIDGKNYPDLSKYNLTFNNVVVNYGDWMNYHYCRRTGERAVRVEAGYSYDGAEGRDHSGDNQFCMEWIPFNQLIGGDQYNVKGLPAVDGVTVNYPASYNAGN